MMMEILRCYGYPKYTFAVSITANIINLILSLIVVHYPEYCQLTGVAGIVSAGVISTMIQMIITTCLMVKVRIKLKKPERIIALFRYMWSILRLGLPWMISSASFTISQTITTGFVALIGDYALSAKVYYTTILSYVYLFSISVGSANALLIGRCYGAGQFERMDKMNRQLIKLTIPVNMLISVAVILMRKSLVGFFTDNELIIGLSLGIFIIDIIAEQARAVSQIYENSLKAIGDIMFSVVFLVASCWIFSIGLAYFLAIRCNMGLIGCWIGIALDESTRGVVTYFRWRNRKKNNFKIKK